MVKVARIGEGVRSPQVAALDGREQPDQRQTYHHRQHHTRYERPEEELVVELQVHVEQDDDGELDARQDEQQDGGGRLTEGVGDYLLRLNPGSP